MTDTEADYHEISPSQFDARNQRYDMTQTQNEKFRKSKPDKMNQTYSPGKITKERNEDKERNKSQNN